MSPHRRVRVRRALGFLTALVVTSTFLQADPPEAQASPVPLPAPAATGKPAKAVKAPSGRTDLPDRALAMARKPTPAPVWPAAGEREVTVTPVTARAAKTTPVKAKLRTYDHETSVRVKVDGPVMRLTPAAAGTVRLTVDYAAYSSAGSANFGARLTLVSLPECALTTPETQACAPVRLAAVNDSEARTLTAEVPVAAASSLVAVTATESSAQGSFAATPLSPTSTWSVTPSSGAFNWSFPVNSPSAPGGFGPGVSFGYNSQTIDGRTSITNNQGSWVGEGFSYEPGYVERRYKSCADDGHKEVGDLCWAYDNAVLSLNGKSSELVRSGDTWRLASDDGSKIEKLSGATNRDEGTGAGKGEHWKLTTTDGIQYFFGLNQLPGWSTGKVETKSVWTVPVYGDDKENADDKLPSDTVAPAEPCYNATFANAKCQQAWRWNLDYALDRHGNVMTYYYTPEKNSYALGRKIDVAGTEYDRGGYLDHIEYGLRAGSVYTTAAATRVDFAVAERCDVAVAACKSGTLNKDTQSAWPDVPFDRICAAGAKCTIDQATPTFFTRKRLTTVTTQVRNGATTWTPVDRYTLDHLFTDNGDGSSSLWLHTITEEGVYGGGTALKSASVRLDALQLPNRILKPGGNDMLGKMVRPRLGTVYSDSGSQIDIEYAKANCSADSVPDEGKSTKRCFPVKWHGAGVEEVVTDWFHKYVVAAVRETDLTTVAPGTALPPDMVTFYTYEGDAAWRYPDPDGMTEAKYQTWNEWRGYASVLVTKGDDNAVRTRSRHFYLQGMDGDKNPDGGTRSVTVEDSTGTKYTDYDEAAGLEYETDVLDAAGAVVSKETTTSWRKQTAAQTRSFGTRRAYLVRPETKRNFTALEAGGWHETKTVTAYDGDAAYPVGRVTQVEDQGDVTKTGDERCSRTTYADNTATNIRTLIAEVETVAVPCATTPNRATQLISDARTYFDNGALGAAPTRGLVTKTEKLKSHNGTTATYQTFSESKYDAYGRPTWGRDAGGTESRLEYVETNGRTTKKTEFSPKMTIAAQTPVEFAAVTEYDPGLGMPTKQYDWNNKLTEMAYDKLGRLTSVWLPNRKSSGDPSIKYTYVTGNGKPAAVRTERAGNTTGVWSSEWQIFDGFLRPRQVQGEGPDGRMVADTWYTSTGEVDRMGEARWVTGSPSSELLLTNRNDPDLSTGYLYDGLDRVTDTITFVAGQEKWRSRTYYGGDRTYVQPPQGGVATATITDARGQVTEQWQFKTNPASGKPSGAHDTTKYTYTAAGQLATVTDPDQDVWSYAYNQAGQRISATDPDSGTGTFAYDTAGRLLSTEDARHRKIETEYDDLGRVTATYEVAGTVRTPLTKQTWDVKAKGQPYISTRFVNNQQYASAVMTMDDFYRPLETRYVIPADAGSGLSGTYSFFTAYNTDGTLQSYGTPTVTGGLTAEAVAYTYDNLQRVKTVSTAKNPMVTSIAYDPTGEVTDVKLNAGQRTTQVSMAYERGTRRLLTSKVTREAYTTPTNPVPDRPANDVNQQFKYDPAGNVLSIENTPATGQIDTQCFAYDYLNRMTDAFSTGTTGDNPCAADTVGGVAPYHHSYTYDGSGNRLTETVHAAGDTPASSKKYDYPDGHELSQLTETASSGAQKLWRYEYDASGNTTKRSEAGEDQTLTWDAEGHLASATAADGTKTSYVYGPTGERLLRKEPKATTLYLPSMELRIDTTTGVLSDTRYYGLPGGVVAVRSAKGMQWQIADRNGTGEAAVDAVTGDIVLRRSTPFGGERGVQPTAAQWVGERGFVGGTKDSTTGLTHLGAREYDPVTGRFISVDPVIDVTDPQRMNAYAYANNSPVTFSDPSGLKFCSDDNCGDGADFVDTNGDYHEVEGDNDGCGGCSGDDDNSSSGSSGDSGSSGSSGTSTVASTGDNTSPEVKKAKSEAQKAQEMIEKVGRELIKFVADELGITDAIDCFTKGDIGGCVSTLMNIVSMVVGGAVGKLVARYWNKLDKLDDLYKRAKSIGTELWKAFDEYKKSRKALQAVEEGASCAITFEQHSFAAGTMVLMADGSYKAIEDIRVGEKVVTYDAGTGAEATEEITATHVNLDHYFTDVSIKGEVGEAVLYTTANHPLLKSAVDEWAPAAGLVAGDALQSTGGAVPEVVEVRDRVGSSVMYDLTVDDIHAYFVRPGDTPVLVHNATPSQKCDLTLGAGPYAREGVALVDGDIDDPFVRDLINVVGDKNGCHTCTAKTPGTREGDWIPDHQPATKIFDVGIKLPQQTAYPHCLTCARIQGGVVSSIKRNAAKGF
ncbi:RHS repeat-associated core domain-containing protein [Winogradskya humida]|uniref:Type IV secretion protein Rhs n=1 Tax=Winogradskya humida TaxID=113566 RepID=A0ABQ4A2Q3_9ACTN|nr:RHS repeat-associated core domain-containing protein [Actinoplanes humidus]GIE25127.1 type IV secretion protein Rhs [Actinoplanes humidus]